MLKCFSPALGGAGVNPAVLGRRGGQLAGFITQPSALEFTPTDHLESPASLTCASLDCGRNLENPRRDGEEHPGETKPPDVVPAEATLPHLITIDRLRSKYPSRSTLQTQVRIEVPDFSMEQKSCVCSATAAGKQK